MDIINTKTQKEFDEITDYFIFKEYKWCTGRSIKEERVGMWEKDGTNYCICADDCRKEIWRRSLKAESKDNIEEYNQRALSAKEFMNSVDPETKRKWKEGFKVGDKVKVVKYIYKGVEGTDKSIGTTVEITKTYSKEYEYRYRCSDYMNRNDNELELINKNNMATDEIYSHMRETFPFLIDWGEELNQPKPKKMSIVQFAKNLALKPDEKELRKAGLRDECGIWTQEAIEIEAQLACDDKREKMVEIAEAMKNDEKKK